MGSLARRLKRRQQKEPEHNYKKKLLGMLSRGEIFSARGAVTHIHVLHDDYCPALDGGICNCDPDIKVDPPGRRIWVQ